MFRHKDAFYFLPTEDEWVKAAYWNGTSLQTWATINDTQPVVDVDSRYGISWNSPWIVGSGSQELNGTYDMMGNIHEWVESPSISGDYLIDSRRGRRGGNSEHEAIRLSSTFHSSQFPSVEYIYDGFRVASIPEPATLSLLALGVFLAGRKRKA